MFGKLAEIKQKTEEVKQRLETISVYGEAEGGKVKVTASGARKIQEITVDDSLLQDKEQLQDLLTVAVNRALEQADKVSEAEMKAIAGDLMPGLGALGNFFK